MAECILLKSGGGTGSDDCTATKANVLSGCTAVTKDSDDEAAAGTMANRGAWTSRIGVNGKVVIPEGYHDGKGYVDQAITNRGAVNASLLINGTYTIPEGYHSGAGKVTQNIATMGAQTVTPGNSQKVVSCSGKYMTGNVTVPAVTNLIAANIKKGVNVGGVVGTWEGYVAAATDLYYNGVNNAGFVTTSTGIVFESGQINQNHTGVFTMNTSATYNLGGYSYLIVEGNMKIDYHYVYPAELETKSNSSGWTILSKVQVQPSTTYTSLSFPLNNQWITAQIGLSINALTAGSYIRRVRLA